jgi:phospholipid transport system substrate-binding protein
MSRTNPLPPAERLGRRTALLGMASLALVAAAPVVGAAEAARDFIEKVGNQTLAILQRGDGDPERLPRLVAVLNDAVDLELVGRLVLGQYWRQASDSQRQEYLRLFRALVIKTIAERLNSYGGETFEIIGSKPVDERDAVVSTKIVRPASGHQPIAVDWRVRSIDGRLAIIDIVAEGVSMIVTQRSEVGSVVSQKGVDGLLTTMRERLAKSA